MFLKQEQGFGLRVWTVWVGRHPMECCNIRCQLTRREDIYSCEGMKGKSSISARQTSRHPSKDNGQASSSGSSWVLPTLVQPTVRLVEISFYKVGAKGCITAKLGGGKEVREKTITTSSSMPWLCDTERGKARGYISEEPSTGVCFSQRVQL